MLNFLSKIATACKILPQKFQFFLIMKKHFFIFVVEKLNN